MMKRLARLTVVVLTLSVLAPVLPQAVVVAVPEKPQFSRVILPSGQSICMLRAVAMMLINRGVVVGDPKFLGICSRSGPS